MIIKGKKVKLHYEGRLESGEIFDSSRKGDYSKPLEFEAGSGAVIKGFDDAVIGMKIGQTKEFSIPPKEAYGEYREKLKREIPRSSIPIEQELKAGMVLAVQTPQGPMPLKIAEVKGENIVIDFNHPLAGKKLIFKIEIIEIN
jgi:peptidylprolyl isomerase